MSFFSGFWQPITGLIKQTTEHRTFNFAPLVIALLSFFFVPFPYDLALFTFVFCLFTWLFFLLSFIFQRALLPWLFTKPDYPIRQGLEETVD